MPDAVGVNAKAKVVLRELSVPLTDRMPPDRPAVAVVVVVDDPEAARPLTKRTDVR